MYNIYTEGGQIVYIILIYNTYIEEEQDLYFGALFLDLELNNPSYNCSPYLHPYH